MRRCSVTNCGLHCGPGRRLYSLPSDEDQRREWLSWLNDVNGSPCGLLPKQIFICSDHFNIRRSGSGSVPKKKPNVSPTLLLRSSNMASSPVTASTRAVTMHPAATRNETATTSQSSTLSLTMQSDKQSNVATPRAAIVKQGSTTIETAKTSQPATTRLPINMASSPVTASTRAVTMHPAATRNGTATTSQSSTLSLTMQSDKQSYVATPRAAIVKQGSTTIETAKTSQPATTRLPIQNPLKLHGSVPVPILQSSQDYDDFTSVIEVNFLNGRDESCSVSKNANHADFSTVVEINILNNDMNIVYDSGDRSGYCPETMDFNEYTGIVELHIGSGNTTMQIQCEGVASDCTDTVDGIMHNPHNDFSVNGDLEEEKSLDFNEDENHTLIDYCMDGVVLDENDYLSFEEDEVVKRAGSVRHKCCAVNCVQDTSVTCFTFPNLRGGHAQQRKQLKRFAVWLQGCGNRELLKHSPQFLHRNFYLCAKHFDDSCFYNKSKLASNAVPTKFSCKSLSNEEVSCFLSQLYSGANESGANAGFNFENEQKQVFWVTCSGCHEKHLSCVTTDCVHKSRCKLFQSGNEMDPGQVPDELKDLTFIEEQLIARVHPLISVFKLKGLQFGYSGNVINFSQNVAEFAKKLPHRVEDLPSVLTIRYENEFCKPKSFTVRSAVVYRALVFLKENNPFYSDIEICQENIDLLPVDGNVLEQIPGFVCEEHDGDDNGDTSEKFNEEKSGSLNEETNESHSLCEENVDESSNEERSESGNLYHSGISEVTVSSNEQQVESNLFEWPVLSSNPVNEFDTPGYIATAFPKLFPYGKADMKSPRSQKVKPADYFQHLLNYEDGRFAKHETFRFFAMNSLMRWSSCTNGSIFVQNNPEFKDITLNALKEMLQKNPLLMKKIMLQSALLRGSKQYWSTRTGELTDMCEQLGLPTIFLTLSCADLHWPELFRLLTGLENVNDLTEKERRELLQQNPYIVDSFFHQRVQSFIKNVVCVKYPVTDYWYRIEYQHRGSPHMHGVFWFEDAPDVRNIKTANKEELKHICDYFDKIICAVNPNPKTENSSVHPSRLLRSAITGNVESEEEDLAQLCVRVQRHTKCSSDYCLKGKKGEPKKCKFNFPQVLQEASFIEFDDDNGEPRFVPARNDPLLNKLNWYFIEWWRANLDVSPVLSQNNLLHYLSKYISKCETRSKSLGELFQNVFEDFNETDPVVKFIRRLYIRSFSERDFSAQEVCHILSGRFLYTAGKRKFVHVNLNSKTMWKKIGNFSRPSATVVEKYMKRPPKLDDLSLWQFAKTRDVTRKGYPQKLVENIVQVFPRAKLELTKEDNENYYRCQVLLHVPWRTENDFLDQKLTWKEIYKNENIDKVFHKKTDLPTVQVNDVSEAESDTEDDGDANLEEFMVLSRIGPKKKVPDIELGLRECDVAYDWSKAVEKYKQYGTLKELSKFVEKNKAEEKEIYEIDDFNCNDYQFNEEQMAVIAQVEEQILAVKNQTTSHYARPNKFTIVQGKAGTGKSVLIRCIKWKVQTSLNQEDNGLILLAPTGVTALNVGGRTIQSGLRIPKQRYLFSALSGSNLNQFCNEMENVHFMVCDEYSMIGAAMLRLIDLRCRQGKGVDEIFGGLFVYFFGDIRQLPPVLDTPLYRVPKASDLFAVEGIALVHCLEKVFFLKKCFRQQDQQFVDMLDRISIGEPTLDDYKLLTTRFIYTGQVNDDFKNALRLFSTKKKVKDFNYKSVENLKFSISKGPVPVVKIKAQHNCKTAENGSAEEAEGLHEVLYLGLQCKIMLTTNLWTPKGLCNGAIGYVQDILYDDDEDFANAFPKAIICKFENYTGPGIGPMNLVPIRPITRYWEKGFVQCSRLQFPLAICYSCSIHKSQGLSLDKSVTDIGEDEFALGITYVALSRAREINGLLLVPFSFERLTRLKNHTDMKRKLDFEKFLESKM